MNRSVRTFLLRSSGGKTWGESSSWTMAALVAPLVMALSLAGCGATEATDERGAQSDIIEAAPLEQSAEWEPAVYAAADSGSSGSFPTLAAIWSGLGAGEPLWQERSTPESIVAKDGVLYVVSSEPALSAVEIESGLLLWKHQFKAPVLAPPVVGEAEIWAAAIDGTVLGLSTLDGAVRQEYQIDAAVYRSPVLMEQELLVVDETGSIHQLPRNDEGSRARYSSSANPQSFLADRNSIVTVSGEGQIRAFALDGRALEDQELEYGPDLPLSAALQNGVLYVGGRGFSVYDLSSDQADAGARELGRVEAVGAAYQILVSEYGPVILDLYGYLHLLNSETLELRFSRELSGEPTTAAVVDSVVYVGTDTGELYGVELPGGNVLWEAAAGDSAVRALFPLNEGLVVAFAADGVHSYFEVGIGESGQQSDLSEVAQLPETIGVGVYPAVITDDGIQTRFVPEQTDNYEIQAVGRDGEEILIILLDEQGREMARNVGYRVEPTLAAELNADSIYGIRLEPVMRGVGEIEIELSISQHGG